MWLLLLLAGGCTNSTTPQNPLVGKWQMLPVKAKAIEFLVDGTAISTTTLSTQVLTKPATYKVVDDAHIIITTKVQQSDAKTSDIPIEYHIAENRLTMKYPNKLSLEFDKIE